MNSSRMDPSIIEKLLSSVNNLIEVENVKHRSKKVVYDPARPKKGLKKYSKLNDRRSFMEKKEKKRRKMAYQSRRINRLRGVG